MSKNSIEPIAHRPERAAVVSARPRTRIFNAIKSGELQAHKDGKATIIFDDELRRWMKTFRVIRRDPDAAA